MTTRFADLDALAIQIDKLKHVKGAEGAKLAAEVLFAAKQTIQRQHARILADQHYLDGVTMRTIAPEQNVSVNAVSLWLRDYGPKAYWTLRQEDDKIVAERVPPREVRRLVQAGRRAIPATWGLGDVDTLEEPLDGYWHMLASQA